MLGASGISDYPVVYKKGVVLVVPCCSSCLINEALFDEKNAAGALRPRRT